MPALRRHLFNIASVLSMLLCVIACAFWAQPREWYGAVYTTPTTTPNRSGYGIAATASTLNLWGMTGAIGWNPGLQWKHDVSDLDPWFWFNRAPKRWRFAGMAYFSASERSSGTINQYVFIIHLSWIAALAVLLPMIWIIRKIKTVTTRSPGTCRSCGYNLTGNTSGVCPECGTPVKIDRAQMT